MEITNYCFAEDANDLFHLFASCILNYCMFYTCDAVSAAERW